MKTSGARISSRPSISGRVRRSRRICRSTGSFFSPWFKLFKVVGWAALICITRKRRWMDIWWGPRIQDKHRHTHTRTHTHYGYLKVATKRKKERSGCYCCFHHHHHLFYYFLFIFRTFCPDTQNPFTILCFLSSKKRQRRTEDGHTHTDTHTFVPRASFLSSLRFLSVSRIINTLSLLLLHPKKTQSRHGVVHLVMHKKQTT